jgi:hypothetical protein
MLILVKYCILHISNLNISEHDTSIHLEDQPVTNVANQCQQKNH